MDWAVKIYIGAHVVNRPKGDIVETPDEPVETWTTGQAAAYLRDLGVSRRKVRRLVDSKKLAATTPERGEWARVSAEAVRAYRAELLAQLRLNGDHPASTIT